MSELAKALVTAQASMPAVPKNATAEVQMKTGGKYSYMYVTLDSLISKTLPVLNKNGLAITQAPEHIEGHGVGLRTTLTHVGGESMSSVMPIVGGHSMQDLGGAITYARRYAWASLLGIASEHDDDAGAVSSSAASTPKQTSGDVPRARSASAPVAAASPEVTIDTPGSTEIGFGKHKGSLIRDVPKGYLEWWLNSEMGAKPEFAALRAEIELFLGLEDAPSGSSPDLDDIPF